MFTSRIKIIRYFRICKTPPPPRKKMRALIIVKEHILSFCTFGPKAFTHVYNNGFAFFVNNSVIFWWTSKKKKKTVFLQGIKIISDIWICETGLITANYLRTFVKLNLRENDIYFTCESLKNLAFNLNINSLRTPF